MLLFMVYSLVLLILGSVGLFICRKNIILAIMCLEVMLFSVTLNFIFLSDHIGDLSGQIFSLFLLTISASESAIGLSLVIVYHKDISRCYLD